MENHHVSWENQLSISINGPFSTAMWLTKGYLAAVFQHGDFPRCHRGLRSRLRRRAQTAASQDPARSGDAKVCREISPAIIHVVRVVHVISPNYGYITKLCLYHQTMVIYHVISTT